MKPEEAVAFKGTRNGILLSIREDAGFDDALALMDGKIKESGEFFRGAAVSVDLGWREAGSEELTRLAEILAAIT